MFRPCGVNGLLGTAIPALGLLLPIGISFYTFQTMSYTIDVYRGLVPPWASFFIVVCRDSTLSWGNFPHSTVCSTLWQPND